MVEFINKNFSKNFPFSYDNSEVIINRITKYFIDFKCGSQTYSVWFDNDYSKFGLLIDGVEYIPNWNESSEHFKDRITIPLHNEYIKRITENL